MIIATFRPTTAWVGRSITYEDGQFVLEGHGPVAAASVTDYDRQGHLDWAYDGLREWAYETAGQPAPPPVAEATAQPASPSPVTPPPAEVQPSPVTPPPAEVQPSPVTPPPAEVQPSPVTPPPAEVQPSPQPVAAPPPSTAVTASTAAATPSPQWPPQPPAVGPPATPQPPAAVGGPASPPPSRGWVLPVALVAVALVALVIAFVLTDGRVRDALGVTATVTAVAAGVVLLVVAFQGGAGRRLFFGLNRGAAMAVSGVLCGGLLVLGAVLWWMPHYEVIVPGDTRIVLDESPAIPVKVVNHGLLGGEFSAGYSIDGETEGAKDVHVGAGESRTVELALPSSAEPGVTVLTLGGTEITARAVRPPEYSVEPLLVTPEIAKEGDTVTVETQVSNSGDIAGTFAGSLQADGDEIAADPVEVGPGSTEPLSYSVTAGNPGKYLLTVGDAAQTLVIVKPVRLANGKVVTRRVKGGRAHLTVKNGNDADAMVVLTRSSAPRTPVLVVYVRGNQRVKVDGIPDGRYIFWDALGEDWNWYTRDFLTVQEYKRWLEPLQFSTRADTDYWTTSWSDSSYIYTQKHSKTTTKWSNWKVTLGSGVSEYTKIVSKNAFPRL